MQDYICNRIYTLPEAGIERYLSQMVTLLVSRPDSGALERCVVDLCGRSLRLAVKVNWYLQAALDDKPTSAFLKGLMQKCETAAIKGEWRAPPPVKRCMSSSMGSHADLRALDGADGAAARAAAAGAGVGERAAEGSAVAESATQTQQGLDHDLSSPRQRQGTYTATISIVAELCDAAQGIKEIPSLVDRQAALRGKLALLNQRIANLPAHASVLFPMGRRTARFVRVPPDECALLNSRDKSPFMVCIEVINDNDDADGGGSEFEEWHKPKDGDPLDRLAKGSEFETFKQQSLLERANACPPPCMPLETMAIGVPVEPMAAGRPPLPPQGAEAEAEAGGSSSGGDDAPGAAAAAAAVTAAEAEASKARAASEETAAAAAAVEARHEAAREGGYGKGPPDSIALAIDAAMHSLRDRKLVRARLTALPEEDRVSVELWPVGSKQPPRVASTDGLAAMMKSQRVEALAPPRDANFVGSVAAPLSPSSACGGGTMYPKSGSIFGHQKAMTEAQRQARVRARSVFGERWSERVARIREQSPYGAHPRWQLHTAIVKRGDDCRQELLAVQLMYTFQSIFQDAGLPLWVRPYQVLVTSGLSSFIETVPNALSIHAIKARSPQGTSLRDHFAALYIEGSAEFRTAQRNFVESLAAASIISYLLQLKDRHNGNLMLDDEGHIIHIDFGFMLSNSPGNINFESAPFKLTREFLEVMDSDAEGTGSDLFDYFKVLCIQGFLAARKHAEHIVCMVEMMQVSNAPCYKVRAHAPRSQRATGQVRRAARERDEGTVKNRDTEKMAHSRADASSKACSAARCRREKQASSGGGRSERERIAEAYGCGVVATGGAQGGAADPQAVCAGAARRGVRGAGAAVHLREPGRVAHPPVRLLPARAQWHLVMTGAGGRRRGRGGRREC